MLVGPLLELVGPILWLIKLILACWTFLFNFCSILIPFLEGEMWQIGGARCQVARGLWQVAGGSGHAACIDFASPLQILMSSQYKSEMSFLDSMTISTIFLIMTSFIPSPPCGHFPWFTPGPGCLCIDCWGKLEYFQGCSSYLYLKWNWKKIKSCPSMHHTYIDIDACY